MVGKCDLSIELESPNAVRSGGDLVRGVVTVRADADVRCKGLEIQTCWKTHGRGNIDQGTGETTIAFEGDWLAGQTYHYPFELASARWPPTYHGHYLNVDHYVEARAMIPWAFDPKAAEPFQVLAADGPEASKDGSATGVNGCGGKLVGGIIAMVVVVVSLFVLLNPFFWIFGFLAALAGGIWWLAFRWMPAHRLGPVEYRFESLRLAPGQQLRGELTLRPLRDVRINEITLTVSAVERCVSGSGSNRTTHRHTLYEQKHTLMPSGALPGGRTTQLPLAVQLPDKPIYSLDLSDNDLNWAAELRIDIPRWPDWKRTEKLQVVPAVAIASQPVTAAGAVASAPYRTRAGDSHAIAPEAPPSSETSGAGEGITFDETMRHLWSARQDEDQIQLLVEAVQGLPFDISAHIERRLLYGNDDPAAFRNGYVVWAHYPDPPMPLTLYVPHGLGDDFEQVGREIWRGRGAISGYDERHNRVQITVDPASPSGK